MALQPEELHGAPIFQKPNLRFVPYEGGIRPGTLSAISPSIELPHGTPLAYDETLDVWNVWDPAVPDIADISGFLWIPEASGFTTDAADEKLIQVFRRGQVHYDDVPLPTTAAQSQPQLLASLTATNRLRTLGIDLQGIVGVH